MLFLAALSDPDQVWRFLRSRFIDGVMLKSTNIIGLTDTEVPGQVGDLEDSVIATLYTVHVAWMSQHTVVKPNQPARQESLSRCRCTVWRHYSLIACCGRLSSHNCLSGSSGAADSGSPLRLGSHAQLRTYLGGLVRMYAMIVAELTACCPPRLAATLPLEIESVMVVKAVMPRGIDGT
jgi:hypothetical protein